MLKIAFVNPPHADWSLANNMTYLQIQSHYQRFGSYKEQVEWIPAPYRWNCYTSFTEVYAEICEADIFLMSSYVWNAEILDEFSEYIKMRDPEKVLVIGGPHIGTNDADLLQKRKRIYDFICQPTKPGEAFVEDLINSWFDNQGAIAREDISWELSSFKSKKFVLDQDYSVYEDHFDHLSEVLAYARKHNLEPFVVLETTRGCPYRCVYCEWGGGINTRIQKKNLEIVKRDILSLKKAGFRSAYLTDANFGVFKERDFEIYQFAWDNQFYLTDISTVKTPNLELRKELVDFCSEVVGEDHDTVYKEERGTDMWGRMEYVSIVPTVSIQSISDTAMKIAERVDLKSADKIALSEYLNQVCEKRGYPKPALELILAMPGSTLDDFYNEMDVIWNFKAWSSFRHDYMFLPDSTLNSETYKEKYGIETVKVYSDIVDEDGIDNFNSLYRNKETHYETIRSCFSFSEVEMREMWFMNSASNYLLKDIYPEFTNYYRPPEFARKCFREIRKLTEYSVIDEDIKDIFNPLTPARSIRRLGGTFRVEFIERFLKRNILLIKDGLLKDCLVGDYCENSFL